MRLKKILKAIARFFKKHWPKWTILAILVIIIYLGFVFYHYIYKPAYQSKELTPYRLEIEEQIYQEIMDSYNQRQENINKIINKDYPNPFE